MCPVILSLWCLNFNVNLVRGIQAIAQGSGHEHVLGGCSTCCRRGWAWAAGVGVQLGRAAGPSWRGSLFVSSTQGCFFTCSAPLSAGCLHTLAPLPGGHGGEGGWARPAPAAYRPPCVLLPLSLLHPLLFPKAPLCGMVQTVNQTRVDCVEFSNLLHRGPDPSEAGHLGRPPSVDFRVSSVVLELLSHLRVLSSFLDAVETGNQSSPPGGLWKPLHRMAPLFLSSLSTYLSW